MRRVILAVTATIAGLVALLSFKSHSPERSLAPESAPLTGTGASSDATTAPVTLAPGERAVTGSAVSTVYGPVQVQLILKAGKIVNITSIGGKMHEPFGAWYHATKFAVEGMSDCLRMETAPFGIDALDDGKIRLIARGLDVTALKGRTTRVNVTNLGAPKIYIPRKAKLTFTDFVGRSLTGTTLNRFHKPGISDDGSEKKLKIIVNIPTTTPTDLYIAQVYDGSAELGKMPLALLTLFVEPA